MIQDIVGVDKAVLPTAFRKRNQELAETALDLLEDEHPMTLRQLYYRLVSAGALQPKLSEYRRIGAIMVRLREAGEVPLTWIVDHVRQTLKPSSWSGLGDFGDTVRHAYRKNFWPSMPAYVCLFVEKDAVAGTLQPATESYDVALHVCRGHASISFVGEIAEQWKEIEKPIHAYYLGDRDPSGMDIERDLQAKLERYSGRLFFGPDFCPDEDDDDVVVWRRLAVVEPDFDAFDLIRLQVKQTDPRAATFTKTYGTACAELDALPPTELRRRVEQAILSHVDSEQWKRLQNIERVERESVHEVMDQWKAAS